jgi:ribulose-phosphate 3-epimerase
MIEDANRWAPVYAAIGVFSVTVHFEACSDAVTVAKEIREHGVRAGLSIKPNTPVSAIEGLIEHFDQILVMSVEPGFGGQSFMESALSKISEVRHVIDTHGLDTWVQVDGGIDLRTIAEAAKAGADTFVAGSTVFGAPDRNTMIDDLRKAAENAVR